MSGRVFPEVLLHLRHRDHLCGLVFPGVLPPIHSGKEQVSVLQRTPKYHWLLGHFTLLHFPHLLRGWLKWGGWQAKQQHIFGEGWFGATGFTCLEDLVCNAPCPTLLGLADFGPHSSEMHTGIWPAFTLLMRGCHSVLSFGLSRREWIWEGAWIYKHTCFLLVGYHFNDHCGVWRYGTTEHPRPDGGSEQHPQWDSHHVFSCNIDIPHFLPFLLGVEKRTWTTAVSATQSKKCQSLWWKWHLQWDRQLDPGGSSITSQIHLHRELSLVVKHSQGQE